MKFVTAMFIGAALIVGVAIGYMFNPSVEAPEGSVKHEKPTGAIRDGGNAESTAALRARIAELEAKLSEKNAVLEKSEARVEVKNERHGPGRGWERMSPKEWREKMKKEDPERYIQMTNSFARMRRERLERAQKKVDFFSSIDVSRMSASARKTHEALQDLIARREELEQKLHGFGELADDLSSDDRRAIFEEMRDLSRQIQEQNACERENLMRETIKNLGFEGNEVADIAEAFQEIIENTEGGFNTTGRPSRGDGNGALGGEFPPPPPIR